MGCDRCPNNKWYSRKRWKGEKLWAWRFGDLRDENRTKASMATWNPKTGLFKMQFNIYGTLRYSPTRSTESVGKALKKLFKADKYFCYVGRTNGSKKYKGYFTTRMDWCTKLDSLPKPETMDMVRDTVMGSLEELMCVARVLDTGVTETYTVQEAETRWEDLVYRVRYNERLRRSPLIGNRVWKLV